MRCAVCGRQARGLGWFNTRAPRGDPDRYSDHWRFCARPCQDAFAQLMEKTEGRMIDPTEMEIAAMQACLIPLGEVVAEIGMEKPFADYTRDEVLTVINVVVTAYQHHMLVEHERMAEKDRAFLDQRLAHQGQPVTAGAPF